MNKIEQSQLVLNRDELLRMRGAQVDARENGALAVEAFRTAAPGTYDAILIDVQMPVMNGHIAKPAEIQKLVEAV